MVRELVALVLRPAPPTHPPSRVLLRSYALPAGSDGSVGALRSRSKRAMPRGPGSRRRGSSCAARTVCWCAPERCHAEVLIELANSKR